MSNATASQSWLENFRFAYSLDAGGAPVTVWRVFTGADAEAGIPVIDDGAGGVIQAAEASAALYGITAVAATTGDFIPVYAAHPKNIFMAQAISTVSAEDYPLVGGIDLTDFGVDLAPGTPPAETLQVIGPVPTDDADDAVVFGRVYFYISASEF